MSDTPRTDEFKAAGGGRRRQWEWADFARQLERENAELRRALEKIVAAHDAHQDITRNEWVNARRALEAK